MRYSCMYVCNTHDMHTFFINASTQSVRHRHQLAAMLVPIKCYLRQGFSNPQLPPSHPQAALPYRIASLHIASLHKPPPQHHHPHAYRPSTLAHDCRRHLCSKHKLDATTRPPLRGIARICLHQLHTVDNTVKGSIMQDAREQMAWCVLVQNNISS